jgi:hypothetical protein
MRGISTRALLLTGLAVALVLAGVASFYASGHPDGLTFVAERLGFIHTQQHPSSTSPLAGYATKGVSNPRLSGGVAGVVGVLVVGLLGGGLFALLRRREPTGESQPGGRASRPGRD